MPKFKKPGYTQIPNEIFDVLMPVLSGAEFKILCLISRKTLGYHRDCHAMTVVEICSSSGLSDQAVVDAAKSLESSGYLIKEKQYIEGGKRPAPNRYSLNIEGDEEQPKNLAIDSEPIAKFSGVSIANLFGGLNKEVKKSTKEKNIEADEVAPLPENQTPPEVEAVPISPTLDRSELCLDDPVEVFCKNAYRRRGKLENLRTKSATRTGGLVERLLEAESNTGPEEFRAALLGYLKTEDDWLRQNQWPIHAFLKNPSKYLNLELPDPPKIDGRPLNLTATRSEGIPAPSTTTDQPAPSARNDGKVLFEELWGAYPAKGRVRKSEAYKQYRSQVSTTADHRHILDQIEEVWKPSRKWAEGYVMNLPAWIENRCWDEEPEPAEEEDAGPQYITVAELRRIEADARRKE